MTRLTREIQWLIREKYHGLRLPTAKPDIARLKRGEPLAYVIGTQPFRGLEIAVSPATLIPRVETEWWIDQVICDYEQRGAAPVTVLDLGAGTGCLGIALLAAFPEVRLTFVDIEPAVFPLIWRNLRQVRRGRQRSVFVESDVFDQVSGTFDLIVANPPYLSQATYATLPMSVRTWEPARALLGGPSGNEVLIRLVTALPDHLHAQHGRAVIEHDPDQSAPLADLASRLGMQMTTREDQFGRARFTIIET